MAVTPDEALAKLKEALASGALEVRFSDGSFVKYDSADALQKRIAYFEAQNRPSGTPVARVSVGAFYRG